MTRIEKIKEIYENKLKVYSQKDINQILLVSDNENPTSYVELFAQYDPTPNKKYLQWMIQCYLKNGYLLEDLIKIPETLDLFNRHKNKLDEDKRDIGKYEHLEDVWTNIAKYKEIDLLKEKEDEEKIKIYEETDFEYEIPGVIRILSPKTYKSSKFWGLGTRWCTTMNEHTFENYNQNGKLHIIILQNGKKYQFHDSSNFVFLNDADREFTIENDFSNRELREFLKFINQKLPHLNEKITLNIDIVKYCDDDYLLTIENKNILNNMINDIRLYQKKELLSNIILKNKIIENVPHFLLDKDFCITLLKLNPKYLTYLKPSLINEDFINDIEKYKIDISNIQFPKHYVFSSKLLLDKIKKLNCVIDISSIPNELISEENLKNVFISNLCFIPEKLRTKNILMQSIKDNPEENIKFIENITDEHLKNYLQYGKNLSDFMQYVTPDNLTDNLKKEILQLCKHKNELNISHGRGVCQSTFLPYIDVENFFLKDKNFFNELSNDIKPSVFIKMLEKYIPKNYYIDLVTNLNYLIFLPEHFFDKASIEALFEKHNISDLVKNYRIVDIINDNLNVFFISHEHCLSNDNKSWIPNKIFYKILDNTLNNIKNFSRFFNPSLLKTKKSIGLLLKNNSVNDIKNFLKKEYEINIDIIISEIAFEKIQDNHINEIIDFLNDNFEFYTQNADSVNKLLLIKIDKDNKTTICDFLWKNNESNDDMIKQILQIQPENIKKLNGENISSNLILSAINGILTNKNSDIKLLASLLMDTRLFKGKKNKSTVYNFIQKTILKKPEMCLYLKPAFYNEITTENFKDKLNICFNDMIQEISLPNFLKSDLNIANNNVKFIGNKAVEPFSQAYETKQNEQKKSMKLMEKLLEQRNIAIMNGSGYEVMHIDRILNEQFNCGIDEMDFYSQGSYFKY
jgi:hypothetical protein